MHIPADNLKIWNSIYESNKYKLFPFTPTLPACHLCVVNAGARSRPSYDSVYAGRPQDSHLDSVLSHSASKFDL